MILLFIMYIFMYFCDDVLIINLLLCMFYMLLFVL